MIVYKIKLKNNGFEGINSIGTDLVKKGDKYTPIEFNITLKIPIPSVIRTGLQNLRYHFLWLTGYLHDDLSEFFEDDRTLKDLKISAKDNPKRRSLYLRTYYLLENTLITGLSRTIRNEIIITGNVRTIVNNESIEVSTPLIKGSGSYPGYPELLKETNFCLNEVRKFHIDGDVLEIMNPLEFLSYKYKDDEKVTLELEKTPKAALEEMYLNELQSMDCIELAPDPRDIKLYFGSEW